MTPAEPARIHLLPASKAPVVVVVRRKPSRLFHIIRVDTVNGRAEHGAWFNGKLFPMRSDVSFDGEWLVYLALGGRGQTWNAVSKLPRLTAAAESDNMGTWFGGGYFRARDVLCLNRWAPTGKIPFRTEQMLSRHGGEDLGVVYPRLERDGWRRRGEAWGRDAVVKGAKKYSVTNTGDDGWVRQPSSRHPPLIMWYAGYLEHGYTFRFRVPDQPDLLDDEVDWANYDSCGQLVAARRGVVTIYGLRGRRRLQPLHTLDFEDARPQARGPERKGARRRR
jgi:hypothetical protein